MKIYLEMEKTRKEIPYLLDEAKLLG